MLTWLLPILVACGGTTTLAGPEDASGSPDSPSTTSLHSLTVEPSEVTVEVGDTVHLSVEGRDGNGEEVSLSDYELSWSSSEPEIATVDSAGVASGVVDAEKDGEVEVSVEATPTPDRKKVSDMAHIVAEPGSDGHDGGSPGGGGGSGDSTAVRADTVIVSPASLGLETGETGTLRAAVEDSAGNALDRTVAWSSEDTSVATVDSEGRVTALTAGTTRVVGTAGSAQGAASLDVTVPPSNDAVDHFRAFPEAEGWGAQALMDCNRSQMQVLTVTNLQDSGTGSLRNAINRVRSDVLSVITFGVAGYIDLSSRIEIDRSASCLYIAGQTAPGDGITVRAWDGQAVMFRSGPVNDVVIRYLRFRNGTHSPGTHGSAQGMLVGAGEEVVLDHLSFSWANDQLLSLYKFPHGWGPLQKITLQRTLFAEPFSTSPVCYTTGGDKEGGGDGVPGMYKVDHISFHHNAAIHCSHRAPGIGARSTDVINSVVYNWNQGAMHSGRKVYVDYIGNYFKRGPMNRPLDIDFAYEFSHSFATNTPRSVEPDGYRIIGNTNNIDGRAGPSLYLEGNVGPHNPSGGLDNWAMTSKYKNDEREGLPKSFYSSVQYADVGKMPIFVDGVRLRRTTRNPSPPVPVTTGSAFDAWNSLIEDENIGANQRLTCTGDWVGMADAVDRRVLREARNGTGRSSVSAITSQADVGGFPDLDPGSPCADSDGDGMPDEFETRYGLDPEDPGDAHHDPDGDRYSNLEEFVNGTVPR